MTGDARRNFLATLASGMADAEGGLTVVLSSHLITDLERVCDHIILLAGSRVQLCGDIDALLAEHKVLVGPRKDTAPLERTHTVVQTAATARQSYWPFQGIETGIYVLLAAALIAVTFVIVRKRDA